MEQISAGAIAMGFAIAGLFFLRFWRQTRDRLFALFAVAFVILALNRVGTGVFPVNEEQGDHLYWVRFFAFLMILVAIIDKNRSRKRPPSKPPGSG